MVKRGQHHSEKSRKKISDSLKGRPHSDEHNKKISEALKKTPPFLGRHHSAEAKEKVSVARKGKSFSEEHKEKISITQKEQQASGRRRANQSKKMKEHYATHPEAIENKKRKMEERWERGDFADAFVRPTTIEIMLWKFLDDNNIPYTKTKIIDIGYKLRKPDAFIEQNIILEADGGYSHSENCHGDNRKAEDEKADKVLKKMGYIIYRIPEVDFRNGKYLETLNRIVDTHHLNQTLKYKFGEE